MLKDSFFITRTQNFHNDWTCSWWFCIFLYLLSCFNLHPGLSLLQKHFLLKSLWMAYSVLVTLSSSSGLPIIHMLVFCCLPSVYILLLAISFISSSSSTDSLSQVEGLPSAPISSFLTNSLLCLFNFRVYHCYGHARQVSSSFAHYFLGIPLNQGSTEMEMGKKTELNLSI